MKKKNVGAVVGIVLGAVILTAGAYFVGSQDFRASLLQAEEIQGTNIVAKSSLRSTGLTALSSLTVSDLTVTGNISADNNSWGSVAEVYPIAIGTTSKFLGCTGGKYMVGLNFSVDAAGNIVKLNKATCAEL